MEFRKEKKMKRKYLGSVAAIAVAAAINMAAIGAAQASAAEFFKCKLAEDATMEQLVTATEAFVVTAKENGHEDYSVRFLSPVYSSDVSRGTFWWVGVGPNLAALGAINDYWESDANTEHRDRFRELSTGCETASLHVLTRVGEME
jgi:hypothetical protein